MRAFADEEEHKTVKVGWYNSDLFQEGKSDKDIKSGYSYEYLQKVSDYTGWNYEYVYGDWNELLNMLVSGEIDILGGVPRSVKRESQILFPDYEMGMDNFCVYQHDDNRTMNAADASSFNGQTVGTVKNNTISTCLEKWIDENGLNLSVVYYDDFAQCEAAFTNGEIDALTATDNVVRQGIGYALVAKIGERPYYLAVAKERRDLLEELNYALEILNQTEPYFIQNLQYSVYGATELNRTFTQREQEWISANSEIVVGYLNGYLPYSGTDKNNMATGVVTDVMAAILDSLGLSKSISVQYVAFDNHSEMLTALKSGEIDTAFPVSGVAWGLEKDKINSSATVISCNELLFFKDGRTKEDVKTVAVNKNNTLPQYYIETYIPEAEIVYFDTTEQCFDAVQNSICDGTLLNSLRLQLYTGSEKYSKLSYVQLADADTRCFGLSKSNQALLMLLNRGLRLIGESYAIESSYNYLGDYYQYNKETFFKENKVEIITAISVLFGAIILLLAHSLIRKQKNLRLTTKLNTQLEEQIDIVGGLTNAYFAMFYADLQTHEFIAVKEPDVIRELLGECTNAEEAFNLYIPVGVIEEEQKAMREFSDLTTLDERMKNTDSIYQEFRGQITPWDWCRASWIAAKRDDAGNLKLVLYAVEDIADSVSEREKQKWADEKHRHELEEQLSLVNTLSRDYLNVYTIDSVNTTVKILKLNGYVTAGISTEQMEYPYEALCRKYINDRVAPEDVDKMIEVMSLDNILKVLSENEQYVGTYRVLEDDEIHYYQYKYAKINGTDLIIAGFQNVDEMIASEKMQRETLQKALSEAEAANMAKTRFLNNMSHDIRTPMNAILGFARLMKNKLDDKDALSNYILKVEESGQYLLSIINNVLDMARIESGKMELDEAVMDIGDPDSYLFRLFTADLEKKNITLTHNVNIKHRYVWTDEAKVAQILVNLISNAIKYTPEGGFIHHEFVEYPSDREGYGKYVTKFTDNGIGMSQEFVEHIFDAFSRERTTTESTVIGTGLGMSIVKKLTDLLGGTIEVESELGKGSTFTLTLEYKFADCPEKQEVCPSDTNMVSLKGKRILLAEDNELNAEIATEILTEYGFIVERAVDGVAAVDMISKADAGYYDVIFMDIQMPNLNGYDATRRIRQLEDEIKAGIPIIAMTANAFEEDKKLAFEAGMNAHVSKPIDTKVIMDTLTQLFGV